MFEKIERIIDEATEEIIEELDEPLTKSQAQLIAELFALYLHFKNDNITNNEFASGYESILEAKPIQKLSSDLQMRYN
ncbi:MAG: hypothetical protein QXE90_04175 [Candidatus Micrarchaeia archaeon]